MTDALAREEALNGMRGAAKAEPLKWFYFLATAVRARVRKRLGSGEERVYESYRVTVPTELARRLGLDEDPELVVAVAKPSWYHGVVYEGPTERLFHGLPDHAKAEVCTLGLAPERLCKSYRTVTIIASEEELRRLGLEPGQAVSLRELLERARRAGMA